MIILKEKVAGYNNTLTLATKEMKFGVNEEVNKVSENSKVPESGTFRKGGESPPFGRNADESAGSQGGSVLDPPLVIPKTD